MSQRTPVPTVGNGQAIAEATQQTQKPVSFPRTVSIPKIPLDTIIDPDEMFTKCTVSEVRAIQQQLRADAEAKQEELRLMVGERYRDLLQASSSIISISQTSQRVLQALEETRDAIITQEEPPLPRRTSQALGVDDRHLYTLQVLSAHLKLLLDAPEHLWRFIERQKYYEAAWLFLLARAMYRALVRDDENGQDTWNSQGVNVLEEFPLVQRQWDVVSQFRSQIIHKSILSLREPNASSNETCAALVTLHLLDSRPLGDTLALLLAQRSKALQATLAWKPSAFSNGQDTNGFASVQNQTFGASSALHITAIREVKEMTLKALNCISQTIYTAWDIFRNDGSVHSLMERVLGAIQSDAKDIHDALPEELSLSTANLLLSLTSSSHFLLLPNSLRSYKPYVDLTSSASSIPQAHFSQKLDEWFNHSCEFLQISLERWFICLHSVKEMWQVRFSIRRWIAAARLKQEEKTSLMYILDDLTQKQVIAIWKSSLSEARINFQTELESSIVQHSERSLVDFLFLPPPLPSSSNIPSGNADITFHKYQSTLKKQLVGRTNVLDKVLIALEQCARTIQRDLSHVIVSDDEPSSTLAEQLRNSYRPVAEIMSVEVVETLENTAMNYNEESENTTEGLVFLAKVAETLSSKSSFISSLGCDLDVIQDFRTKTSALHSRIIDRWRIFTILHIVGSSESNPALYQHLNIGSTTAPSHQLVQALLALSEAVEQLRITKDDAKWNEIMQNNFNLFVTSWADASHLNSDLQKSYDLALLRHMAAGHRIEHLAGSAETFEGENKENLIFADNSETVKQSIAEYLARTQTLFAPVLPCPSPSGTRVPDLMNSPTYLLPFGAPLTTQQSYNLVSDFMKASPRFGLLSVGGNPN